MNPKLKAFLIGLAFWFFCLAVASWINAARACEPEPEPEPEPVTVVAWGEI